MMLRRRMDAMSPPEAAQLLADGQSARVAFLTAKSSSRTVAETVSALANANGGVVLLGVTQKGSVQRANDALALSDLVIEAGLLTDPPLILPRAQVVELPQGPLVALQVPPGLPHI